MAIVPSTDYSGQIATDAAYPQGKAKNVVIAGDGSGTPLEAGWVNDIWGLLQSLLYRAAITPSGDPDEVGTSDYLDALDILFLDAGSDRIPTQDENNALIGTGSPSASNPYVTEDTYIVASVKAMARYESTGSGGHSLFGDFGLTAATNTNYVRFTMDQTMADNRYIVQCTGCDPSNRLILSVEAVTTTYFDVYTYSDAGAPVNPAGTAVQFFVEAKGAFA